VIDIRAAGAQIDRQQPMDEMYSHIAAKFPNKELRHAQSIVMNVASHGAPQPQRVVNLPVGYWYSSADRTKVLQVRNNGLAYSQMKPYTDWATFSSEGRRYWDLYAEYALPGKIQRAGLRYVNQFSVPTSVDRLGEYLRVQPYIPAEISPTISGFTMQVRYPLANIEGMCNCSVAIPIVPPNSASVQIIIDIDVFVEDHTGTKLSDPWRVIETLHHEKNRLFFESVTPKCLELFK